MSEYGQTSAWARQELAVSVLREVLARCAEAAIPVLPVKGIVTARTLYEDTSERFIADLDIRIRPRDFWAWRRVAQQAGWHCWNVVWTYQVRNYTVSTLALDVETGVGPPGMCDLSIEDMMARATEFDVAPDLRVRIPEVHDHAVLLAVNAYKDWLSLGNPHSRVDLDRIVRVSEFRADAFVERAVRARCVTIAWIVARTMDMCYANSIWRAIRVTLEQMGVDRLGAKWYLRLARSPVVHSIPGPAFQVLGIDPAWNRVRALATTVGWLGERWVRGHTGTRATG